MPIAAISANQAMPAAAFGDNAAQAAAPARATDVVSVSSEAKILAAPPQAPNVSASGDLAMVHDFDPERMARLLKLLE